MTLVLLALYALLLYMADICVTDVICMQHQSIKQIGLFFHSIWKHFYYVISYNEQLRKNYDWIC